MIDFQNLKNIYNNQISMLLADDGLTTPCNFSFTSSQRNLCINCIYDPNTKRSSGRYKLGGPISFALGQICPYCSGLGFYGNSNTEENIYMAIIWDSESWINFPNDIQSRQNYIQSICSVNLLSKIDSVNFISIKTQKYQLDGNPQFLGLGDNNYLISTWKRINAN